MKDVLRYTVFVFLGFTTLFCNDLSYALARKPQKMEEISKGVYGTSDALDKGRVDIADVIIKNTKTLVPPPRNPINIQELAKTDQKTGKKTKYVVLPSKMDGTVVKRDSEEFQSLLRDRELLKKYQEGEKAWIEYSNEVTRVLQNEIKEKEDMKATIAKQKQKIESLIVYRNIIFAIGGLAVISIGLYFLQILYRAWIFPKFFV